MSKCFMDYSPSAAIARKSAMIRGIGSKLSGISPLEVRRTLVTGCVLTVEQNISPI
jgi:hypothetical protein